MATKTYRIVPRAEDLYDIQVWIGWRWFGSWEPARESNGAHATRRSAEDAEKFVRMKIEQEEFYEERRRQNEAANRRALAFQAANLPYIYPRD